MNTWFYAIFFRYILIPSKEWTKNKWITCLRQAQAEERVELVKASVYFCSLPNLLFIMPV